MMDEDEDFDVPLGAKAKEKVKKKAFGEVAEESGLRRMAKAMGADPASVDIEALKSGLKTFMEACYPTLASEGSDSDHMMPEGEHTMPDGRRMRGRMDY